MYHEGGRISCIPEVSWPNRWTWQLCNFICSHRGQKTGFKKLLSVSVHTDFQKLMCTDFIHWLIFSGHWFLKISVNRYTDFQKLVYTDFIHWLIFSGHWLNIILNILSRVWFFKVFSSVLICLCLIIALTDNYIYLVNLASDFCYDFLSQQNNVQFQIANGNIPGVVSLKI